MNRQSGFSLIELMIVIVILGLLATLLVPKIMDRPDEARATKTKLDMRSVESALKLYRLDNGFYPSTEQGLKALIVKSEVKPVPRNFRQGGYLESDPKDAWGKEFVYRSPGDEGREYDIISLGADGTEGGAGVSADIKSWELAK